MIYATCQAARNTTERCSRSWRMKVIGKVDEDWRLTERVKRMEAITKNLLNAERYVVWPESWADIKEEGDSYERGSKFLTARGVGVFRSSANKLNHILSELGWLKKGSVKGGI